MLSRRWLIAFACCLVAAWLDAAAIPLPDPPQPTPSDASLIEAILESVGPEGLEDRTRIVRAEMDRVIARMGEKPPSYRRARKLHNLLHRRYLRTYDPDSDRLVGMLQSGRYNCVSAVLFYGMIARSLGYAPEVIAYPGHVLLRIHINGRSIDVETTSEFGFDVGWRARSAAGGNAWVRHDLHYESLNAHRYAEHPASIWRVSLEEAVGFAWVNEAWRSLARGAAARAAEQVHIARSYLPELARAEGIRRLLVQAFRQTYEQGQFDPAYRIAEIDVALFPNSTTSRDRILAAALKRIEAACDAGDPATAETILDQVAGAGPTLLELARLERRTTPLITAAAVRNGNWVLAQRAAERYAAAEPDPIEAPRLLEWVQLRSTTQWRPADEQTCRIGVLQVSDPAFRLETE